MLPRPPIGVSLAGLAPGPDAPWGREPRTAIGWARRAGFGLVQLDAAARGMRPRDLDRSARRDVASVLRREGLRLAGLDLWIPPAHFSDPARVDRAAGAVGGALALAGEMSRLLGEPAAGVVSTELPAEPDAGLVASLIDAAERAGARLADHAVRTGPGMLPEPLGVGVDPAAVLLARGDPARTAAAAGRRLMAARLSDIAAGVRTTPGEGELDEPAYLAGVSIAGLTGAIVLDLRGLPAPDAAARAVAARWASDSGP
jgi:sugar phosphate isomerase/epimerase